jgi:hypothetical protein
MALAVVHYGVHGRKPSSIILVSSRPEAAAADGFTKSDFDPPNVTYGDRASVQEVVDRMIASLDYPRIAELWKRMTGEE